MRGARRTVRLNYINWDIIKMNNTMRITKYFLMNDTVDYLYLLYKPVGSIREFNKRKLGEVKVMSSYINKK